MKVNVGKRLEGTRQRAHGLACALAGQGSYEIGDILTVNEAGVLVPIGQIDLFLDSVAVEIPHWKGVGREDLTIKCGDSLLEFSKKRWALRKRRSGLFRQPNAKIY